MARLDTVQEARGCRWVVGDPATGAWGYCQARPQDGSRYCPHHHHVMFPPPEDDRHVHVKAVHERCARSAGKASSFYIPSELHDCCRDV